METKFKPNGVWKVAFQHFGESIGTWRSGIGPCIPAMPSWWHRAVVPSWHVARMLIQQNFPSHLGAVLSDVRKASTSKWQQVTTRNSIMFPAGITCKNLFHLILYYCYSALYSFSQLYTLLLLYITFCIQNFLSFYGACSPSSNLYLILQCILSTVL